MKLNLELKQFHQKRYEDLSDETVTINSSDSCTSLNLPFEPPAVEVTNFQSELNHIHHKLFAKMKKSLSRSTRLGVVSIKSPLASRN